MKPGIYSAVTEETASRSFRRLSFSFLAKSKISSSDSTKSETLVADTTFCPTDVSDREFSEPATLHSIDYSILHIFIPINDIAF